MFYIAHRGNINGPRTQLENSPDYLLAAIKQGFDVEVDIWHLDTAWWLGHDVPQYKTNVAFLEKISKNAWFHCKNVDALKKMLSGNMQYLYPNFFWHQADNYTLTSYKWIWTYPQQPLTKYSIAVMPEYSSYSSRDLKKCAGICSDAISKYKKV